MEEDSFDELYPLSLMKQECQKLGLDFLIHFGVRSLFRDGNFLGITTNSEWNNQTKLLSVIEQSKNHYFHELKTVLYHNMQYLLRSKELIHNPFLLSLADFEMSNGLGVYNKNDIGLVVYFFTAQFNDKEAINFFINHLHVFQYIVQKIDKHLAKIDYWNKVSANRFTNSLFQKDQVHCIYSNKSTKYFPYKILTRNEEVVFTSRQIQILDFIKKNNITTIKGLAEVLNIETRTVEWHLDEIRRKTGLRRKSDIIDFAINALYGS